jgi:dihydropteroate synthase
MTVVAARHAQRPAVLDAAGRFVAGRPAAVVAIINATPDSFSDGGRCDDPGRARDLAVRCVEAGAVWVDIGGESTRPGALPVPAEAEMERVIPVISAIRSTLPDIAISIDTAKAAVAEAALDAGADIINDVSAGADPAMLPLAARCGCPMVLMHMRGSPADMQRDPRYGDPVAEVGAYLAGRVAAAVDAGIDPGRLAADPGIGFGKRLADNLALLAGLERIEAACGRPLMVGISRKSFLAAAAGIDLRPADRDGLSHQVHAALAMRCAWLRVHDVAGTVAAVRLAAAIAPPGGA